MPGDTTPQPDLPKRGMFVIPAVAALGVLIIVAVAAPPAIPVILVDAISAAVILVPAWLGGLALVPILRPGVLPRRWHYLLGAMLGIGGMSLLMLVLGLAGIMQRPVWIVILCAAAVAGVLRLRRILAGEKVEPGGNATSDLRVRLIWLAVIPFIALALLAASNPPGFIWSEEGFGYDVLEYHLQLPREYLATGRITYLPHNVYANFPAGVEMLYLLAMIVLGEVHDIGTTANMIHLMLAALSVLAAWVTGREWSPRAGIVCAVAVGTVGWLPYLSGLAYVENGLLFFGMTAAAGLARWIRSGDLQDHAPGVTTPIGWLLAIGVAAGFACGCKYTAVPMIALPIVLSVFLANRAPGRKKLAAAGLTLMAAVAVMSPWLVKNQLETGNPVFPVANSFFQATPPGWTQAETVGWNAGHSLPPDQASLPARLRLTWDHLLNDKYGRYGPAIFILAAMGAVRRRLGRVDAALIVMAGLQLGVWLFATHLYGRFMVVWLIPLGLLAGRAVCDVTERRAAIAIAILVGGACLNLWNTAGLHRAESSPAAPASAISNGVLPGFEHFRVVNGEVPIDARVLLVGEARPFYFQRDVDYCVVFNRNSFLERLKNAQGTEEIMQWLRSRGYTHLLVNWSELRRLSATYGLSPDIGVARLEAWFDRLIEAGLQRTHEFPAPGSRSGRYVEIYEF